MQNPRIVAKSAFVDIAPTEGLQRVRLRELHIRQSERLGNHPVLGVIFTGQDGIMRQLDIDLTYHLKIVGEAKTDESSLVVTNVAAGCVVCGMLTTVRVDDQPICFLHDKG